jgi:gluconolactonase
MENTMKNYIITLLLVIQSSLLNTAMASTIGPPLIIGEDFGFTEGPIWDQADQRFLFNDIPNNTTYAVDLKGRLTTIDSNSGFANGLGIDPKGNLWAARHDRKLSFLTNSGKKVIAADTYQGKPLNSPNDIAIKSDGGIWFTDPPFGIQGYGPQKAEEEQAVRGIYRYKDGTLELKSGELTLPNGIEFSPNEKRLYVADTADGWVYRFDINNDLLVNKIKFAKVYPQPQETAMADGIEVDARGNVYVAGPGGIGIFDANGTQIDFIRIDAKHISNMALGGPKDKKLIVTASNKVLIYTLK